MPDNEHILLILDVDETLLHASEILLDRQAKCVIGPYFVYQRPFLREFLLECRSRFQIAIWSSSGSEYLKLVLQEILPSEITPIFVWSRERCVRRIDFERYEPYFVKDLKKVKRAGFNLNRVLIVDDTPKKVERNYGNAIYVKPFFGEEDDDELKRLSEYLKSLRSAANVRIIEKRNWKCRIPDK